MDFQVSLQPCFVAYTPGAPRCVGSTAEETLSTLRKKLEQLHPDEPTINALLEGTDWAKVKSAADRALAFLSGLNLQDHATAEQRELVEIVHLLLVALQPERHTR